MPITKIVPEHAESDGNCAFNAFILGLSEAKVLDNLPEIGDASPDKRYERFIERAQTVFTGTPLTWQKLRDSLIHHKATNPYKLQKTLAPQMRAFAMELIESDLDSYYESTINPLNAELQNYFSIMQARVGKLSLLNSPIDHNTPGMGDIFIRHQFIKDAFDFLWVNYGTVKDGLDQAQILLQKKWKEKGIGLFLASMSNPSIYAGDLELAPLAKYFGINLDVDMGMRGRHSIVRISRLPASLVLEDNSELTLDRSICLKLSTRGIIDVERELEKILPEEVDAILGDIPDYDKVLAFITTSKPVKGTPIPSDWSPACVQQLIQRSIITKGKVFASDLSDEPQDKKVNGKDNREETLRRIAAFPHAKAIAAAWKAVPKAPLMTLQNSAAVHWNNITTIVLPDHKNNNFDSDSDDEEVDLAIDFSIYANIDSDVQPGNEPAKEKLPDLRQIAALKLMGHESNPIVEKILAARNLLAENNEQAKDASDTLFQYYRGIKKPDKSSDRFRFVVHFHALLGLYQWSGSKTINTKYVADFRESLQISLVQLVKKFPAEFDMLSQQEDWETCIKPCLDPKKATKVLAEKLDRLEKIFKQYDDKAWRATIEMMHPSYVDIFNKLRLPRLSIEAFGSTYRPWHLWSPPPREKVAPIKQDQELQAPKYIR